VSTHSTIDPLYKIIKQLSPEEFEDIYQNLTSNKADKSALFLKTIRTSDNPVEDFLEKQDISASAFYVLKSRLNQKVEAFLLNRLGDPKMEAIHKVFKVYDMIFQDPREISITTLKRLEKTMIEMDNPLVLMIVYRALKMLNNDDDVARAEYEKLYNEAVAFYLTNDKAMEGVLNFFRVHDRWVLGRRDRDYQELIRLIEKQGNLSNLYDSQRLYICKSVAHLYARNFMQLPERVIDILDNEQECFEKCFSILERNKEDILFKNINLIFDFLRFAYYSHAGLATQAKIYFEILEYKIEELLTHFNLGMDCSPILFFKLEKHLRENDIAGLAKDYDDYIKKIYVESDRVVTFTNYSLFEAYVAFFRRDYNECSRILYRMRNKVNLRKFPHADLETKLFLATAYVMQEEVDLANQLILSLQRQLKKGNYEGYENARHYLKLLGARLSGKSTKRSGSVKRHLADFHETNKGNAALLPYLDLEVALFPEGKGE
jgi:hypothetical protein